MPTQNAASCVAPVGQVARGWTQLPMALVNRPPVTAYPAQLSDCWVPYP